MSFLGTKIKNPLVGFGVPGIKTLVKFSLILGEMLFEISLVAKPTAQDPVYHNHLAWGSI